MRHENMRDKTIDLVAAENEYQNWTDNCFVIAGIETWNLIASLTGIQKNENK